MPTSLTLHVTAGSAHISLNGHPLPTNISEYNSVAGYRANVPIEMTLDKGDGNWITVGAVGKNGEHLILRTHPLLAKSMALGELRCL